VWERDRDSHIAIIIINNTNTNTNYYGCYHKRHSLDFPPLIFSAKLQMKRLAVLHIIWIIKKFQPHNCAQAIDSLASYRTDEQEVHYYTLLYYTSTAISSHTISSKQHHTSHYYCNISDITTTQRTPRTTAHRNTNTLHYHITTLTH